MCGCRVDSSMKYRTFTIRFYARILESDRSPSEGLGPNSPLQPRRNQMLAPSADVCKRWLGRSHTRNDWNASGYLVDRRNVGRGHPGTKHDLGYARAINFDLALLSSGQESNFLLWGP